MTHVVVIGGVQFGASRPIDGLVFTGLTDWDGKPDARGEGDPIPSRNGIFPRVDLYRQSRAVSVEGAVIADSLTEFHEVRRRLESLPDVTDISVDVGDGVWSRGVEVRSIKVDDFRGDTATTFLIDMVAPDPVRYRDVVVLGPVGLPVLDGGLFLPASMPWDLGTDVRSVLTVVNDGALPCYPVVRLSGSASSVTVLAGPRRLGFGAFTGDLVFDAGDRRAFLNGADVTRQMTRRDWPVVPAGVTHEFSFEAVAPSPDFRMSVEYRIGAW